MSYMESGIYRDFCIILTLTITIGTWQEASSISRRMVLFKCIFPKTKERVPIQLP